MTTLPITVCILVLNEAKNLPECLSRLHGFAEIIVLDSGSTDDTVAIAQSAGARVEVAEWEGFGAARERIFALAKTEWIFWLDADEYLTSDLHVAISEWFANPEPSISGLEVNRMVKFHDQWIHHGPWFPDWKLRLFRRDHWRIQQRHVHESIALTSGSSRRLAGWLEHHSFTDWADYRQRQQRYATLWAHERHEKGFTATALDPFLHGMAALVKALILKRGFQDGRLGFVVARQHAWATAMKYRLLRSLQ